MAPTPSKCTYAGVVSRESVRIAFTYAALHDIPVWAADIKNAYLTAPCSERYHTVCGPEFGSELVGRKVYIVRALYGLPQSGADYREHLRSCMEETLGFESCRGDDDIWRRKAVRTDGTPFWEYCLIYTDDLLVVSEFPEKLMNEIDVYFPLKPGSVGPPKLYLGGKISQVQLPNGVVCYAVSSSQYIQEAVSNLEEYLKKKNMSLIRNPRAPMSTGYRPECDQSPELDPGEAAHYQSLIEMMRWIVELGRVDVCCEVPLLLSQLAMPREGHL